VIDVADGAFWSRAEARVRARHRRSTRRSASGERSA